MATGAKPPTLVVLQLTGGNDPLNTVIPYGDPLYWDNRPTIRIPEQEILHIDDRYGFHPGMAALKPFWDDGKGARRRNRRVRLEGVVALMLAIAACGLTAAMWARQVLPVLGVQI